VTDNPHKKKKPQSPQKAKSGKKSVTRVGDFELKTPNPMSSTRIMEQHKMTKKTTRRTFVKSTAAVGIGFWAAGGVQAKPSRSALEEIRFGCIGVGGKGSSDSADANNQERNGSKVVAICDIDDATLGNAKDKFPGAKQFNDYRKMLEEMGDSIDAVTVSTPDHTHAVAAMMAMKMGKHCFCQKPLTHSIEEARLLGITARENNLVTQMGNQGTADSNLRLSAALIRNGIIGQVKEVHVWTNRPVWPQRPADDVTRRHRVTRPDSDVVGLAVNVDAGRADH